MLASRDIRIKYKQAALGPLWLLIGPLGMLLSITVAFSGVTDVNTGEVPYVLFALVGMAVWTFVQVTTMVAPHAIVMNHTLVRRSTCPRLALVNGSVAANLPPFVVILTATLAGVVLFEGVPLQIVVLPFLVVWLFVFTWALTLLLAAVAVRARDIVSIVPLVVQAGLFLSPVGYPLSAAPPNVERALSLNPVSGLIEAWRWALLDTDPQLGVVAISGAWTLLLVAAGWFVFSRLEVRFADFV